MRIASVFVLVLSTLAGIHATAVETPSHQPYHQQIAAAASHVFHAMASSTTLPGVSTACQTSTDAITNNADVQAAGQKIVHGGCSKLDYTDRVMCPVTKTSPTSATINCNCQAIMTKTDDFVASVQALGGKACPVSVAMTMSASGTASNGQRVTVTANIQQTMSDYQIYGPQCTSQDIQASLDGTAQTGVNQVTALAASNNDGVSLNSFNVQVTACSFTSSRTGAGSMVGVSWFAMLWVVLMSSFMMRSS